MHSRALMGMQNTFSENAENDNISFSIFVCGIKFVVINKFWLFRKQNTKSELHENKKRKTKRGPRNITKQAPSFFTSVPQSPTKADITKIATELLMSTEPEN